ncbi:MAG: hypothetical protein AAGE76_09840 [Pseudomonadota bacterium]
MLIRALAILVAVIALSIGLSIMFGAEVLAALGMAVNQLKLLFAKAAALSSRSVLIWLRAQGLNFARVEIAKRWLTKSLIPLLIGAALQRRIAAWVGQYVDLAKATYSRLMDRYRALPRPVRIVMILIAMFGMLALALSSMSLWLFLFSVQLPVWIIATLGAFWQMTWRSLQKMVFRTLAFMQIYRVWGLLRRRVPQPYLHRLRRFNFRVARIVVRRRRMTVGQLKSQKDGLAMRWALLREYFRHRRPQAPTRDEFDAMRHPGE